MNTPEHPPLGEPTQQQSVNNDDSSFPPSDTGVSPTAHGFDLERLKNGAVPEGTGSRVLTTDEVSDLAMHRAKVFYSETHKPELREYKEYAFTLGFCKGYQQSRQDHSAPTQQQAEVGGAGELLAAALGALKAAHTYTLSDRKIEDARRSYSGAPPAEWPAETPYQEVIGRIEKVITDFSYRVPYPSELACRIVRELAASPRPESPEGDKDKLYETICATTAAHENKHNFAIKHASELEAAILKAVSALPAKGPGPGRSEKYMAIGQKHKGDRTEYIWWFTPPEGTQVFIKSPPASQSNPREQA